MCQNIGLKHCKRNLERQKVIKKSKMAPKRNQFDTKEQRVTIHFSLLPLAFCLFFI